MRGLLVRIWNDRMIIGEDIISYRYKFRLLSSLMRSSEAYFT